MPSDFSTFERGFPYEEVTEFKILTSEMENGVVQKRKKWSTSRKRFLITFKVNTKSQIEAIRDYFITQEGSYDTFSFTDPLGSVEYTVRFKEDTFKITRDAYGAYSATVELVEDM